MVTNNIYKLKRYLNSFGYFDSKVVQNRLNIVKRLKVDIKKEKGFFKVSLKLDNKKFLKEFSYISDCEKDAFKQGQEFKKQVVVLWVKSSGVLTKPIDLMKYANRQDSIFTHLNRQDSIFENVCLNCNLYPVVETIFNKIFIPDDLNRYVNEYMISGICLDCQNEVFKREGVDHENN